PLGCATMPESGCRPPFAAGKASILIVDHAVDAKDRVKWHWARGTATSHLDYGPPFDTAYALCLYDANGLALDLSIPAGAGWESRSNGVKYRSKSGAPDGVTHLQLKSGGD